VAIRKAVIPVAGFGTRVLPASKAIPKELLPVFDRPAIDWVVEEARAAGIEEFIFVTARGKGAIEDYFDKAYELESTLEQQGKTAFLDDLRARLPKAGSIAFVRQQAALGLGHAIGCARNFVGQEPFAILLPDVIVTGAPGCLAEMVAVYDAQGGNVLAVEQVADEDVSKYGIVDIEASANGAPRIRAMVEKPSLEDAPSNLAITGRYILQPEIFDLIANQKAGHGGELQLTDPMAELMARQDFFAVEYDGRSFDCGNKPGYFEAFVAHALADSQHGAACRDILKKLLEN
tara:strand:+ start:1719 stop:2588 length:870 start_codon:yes stop_codon:yes gene_type:complete